jgi:hypothetical protein
MASGFGHAGDAGRAEQADHGVAECGHGLRGVAGDARGAVLVRRALPARLAADDRRAKPPLAAQDPAAATSLRASAIWSVAGAAAVLELIAAGEGSDGKAGDGPAGTTRFRSRFGRRRVRRRRAG